jgi:DNA repair exonuclease SbcCD ATPase subunit
MSLSFIGLTQKTKSIDTSELCIPYNVAQQMLIDLNEYDKLKELSKLDKEEIYQLNNKIVYMEKTISTWEQKDTLNKDIILNVEEKFKIVNNQNEDLRKEVKKLKVKNTMTQIISGVLLTTLTIFSIAK